MKWGIAAALLVLLAAPDALAQTAQNSVLVYDSAFFADARPNTAYDMIGRLPGFAFDDGNNARGFAGTAGNVLIDGERPTSKTDDLQSILQRIPAKDVERIEVIRGGTTGIDMHEHSVVANVVRKKEDSTEIIADVQDQIFLGDKHTIPQANLQITHHTDGSIYEASITRLGGYDDSVGRGFFNITDVATGSVTHLDARSMGRGAGTAATGAATVPLFDGQFKANIALQDTPFFSSVSYTSPGFSQKITDVNGNINGELGLHWDGKVGSTELETLFLQRLAHQTDVNTSDAPLDNEQFRSSANTGETIARFTLRYLPFQSLTLEGGTEGAFNFLDGTSSFIDNGAIVLLPSANARVEERRGEAFVQGTWKISDDWLLETGVRFELSKISETGDTAQTRSFFYPKPRAILTWTPDKDTQVRLRYERVVGQLDFNNFVASSNLSSSGVTAGNANLLPDQHTQYEISAERHFWGKGAIVATLLHEEITDAVDYVPVTGSSGVFDAPGNIGSGKNDQIDIELTLPLDKIGLTNGLLKATNIWRFSSVRDPVTNENRSISAERPQDIELTLSQDINSLKSTWSIFYFDCWTQDYYRLSEVRHQRVIPPYISASWIYKPTPSWSLTFQVINPLPFVYEDKRLEYAGPRNAFPLASIQEFSTTSQPRIYFEIRKAFD